MEASNLTVAGEASVEAKSREAGFAGAAKGAAGLTTDGAIGRDRLRDSMHRRALAVSDLSAGLLGLALTASIMHGARLTALSVASLLAITLVAKLVGLYDQDTLVLHKSSLDEAPLLFAIATVYALLLSLFDRTLIHATLARVEIGALWAVVFVLLLFGRILVRSVAPRLMPVERCMLIGDDSTWTKLQHSLSSRRGARLVSHISLRSLERGRGKPLSQELAMCIGRLQKAVEESQVDRIIIAVRESGFEEILDCILLLERFGVKVSVVPSLLEVLGSAVVFEDIDGLPVLGVREFGLSRSSAFVKRSFDLAVGSIVLVGCLPLFAVVALAVKLTSPGPVFYRQERVGREGARIRLIKFRTMYDGADAHKAQLLVRNETDGIFKIADDPRVTRVGRWLRPSSLDELPQLLNVVRGEMSLVGPRPLVPAEDEHVRGWARRRLHLTPGMTGNWQVLGANRVPLRAMVKIDYLYITNWSLWGDIKALMRTLPHVLGRRGL